MERVKITINDKVVEVPAGISVMDAAEQAGIYIPRLCYEKDLSPYGACRLCVVEIQGMRNLPASCVTPVSSGMVVQTHSDRVMKARRTILELMLANHPLDCFTCEKMGGCDFNRYCYEYDVRESPYTGEKREYKVEEIDPFIVRDMNKCILCGKCVRTCAEITGKFILDYAYRGFNIKASTFYDEPYVDTDCVFCGNCVSACPTGALMQKQLVGKGRYYELEKIKTTCPFCGTGCTLELCVKDGKVIAVTTDPDNGVNGRVLCVKGRFGWDFINSEKRLTTPLIKRNGEFEAASWDEALDLIAEKLKSIKDKHGKDSFAALSSARCTNEENYLLQKFVRSVMGTNSVDHCART